MTQNITFFDESVNNNEGLITEAECISALKPG